MYLCICRSITDRKIKEAIYDGASNMDDIKQGLGAATCCGKCSRSINEVIQETLSKRPKD